MGGANSRTSRAAASASRPGESNMHIVILDGFTLNPGDLSWDDLQALGSCEIYDRTSPADVPCRAANAEIVLTNKTELTREHLQSLSNLKYIGILATGTNLVDLAAGRAR